MKSALRIFSGFKSMITNKKYPCLMAKSVVKSGDLQVGRHEDYADDGSLDSLVADLKNFIRRDENLEKNQNHSYIATFPNVEIKDDAHYEDFLWRLLKDLHHYDTEDWDDEVSCNVQDDNFSYSFNGRAFYLIGMHPKSSRMARRSECPSIVFNLHSQFENLRDMGVYDSVRDRIRRRDKKLQGSINPMLANFGESSEAMQYSGRQVNKEKWTCPYTFTKKAIDRFSSLLKAI